jgi:hypothetical protein
MNMQTAVENAVKAAVPIVGIRFGNINDKTTWVIQFTDAATPQQRAAAQAVVDAFLLPWAGPTADEKEADAVAALNGGGVNIDLRKLFIAKAVSDEAYRLGKNPGALTGPELTAMRSRIANIYKAL